MAVVVSIARGHDASYPFRTIGASADGKTAAERGAGYYLSAVEKGGEPAGIWVGNGAAELGFRDGDTVLRQDFEPLYGQFLDPRDPARETYLGSPPRINAELSALYQAKLAAHPAATADERMRLLTEARSEYEGPVGVQYFDTTFSVDKTISLAHASALASAVEAKQAGDRKLAAEWEERAAGIWAEIEKSVRLYISYMQQETGFVRTGHHGRWIDGLDTGRVEDARDIPVAIFPQHTSRNGDPQLHVHVLWLNKVQTVRDDQWRAVDARGLYRAKGAGSALAAFGLETGLTQRFGFEWAYRPASKGRVIAGFRRKPSPGSPPAARRSPRPRWNWRRNTNATAGTHRTSARWPACASSPTTAAAGPSRQARSTSAGYCASGREHPATLNSAPCATSPGPSGTQRRAPTQTRRGWPRNSRHAENSRTRKNTQP